MRRAAIFVFAQVGAAAQELVDQVAIRAVQLHPVEPGFLRVGRRLAVILDQALDIIDGQRACLRVILPAGGRVRMAGRGRRAGRNRGLATQEVGVDDPPHVPHLQDDPSAFLVHAIGDRLPAFHLFIAPDTRRIGPAEPFHADPGRFTDDQARAGALAVIGFHHRVRDEVRRRRATARQRSHQDAVGGGDRSQAERLEQGVVHERWFPVFLLTLWCECEVGARHGHDKREPR